MLSRLLLDDAALPQGRDFTITGLSADSRDVAAGFVFAALPGLKADGAAFIDTAFAQGAVAAICKTGSYAGAHPVIAVDNPRHVLALMAARFYDRQPDTVVAVTGTNGKTSVAVFVRQIWEAMGFRAASLGTIGVVGPSGTINLGLTTPDAVALSKLVADLRDDHVQHLAIEASSHGIEQNRLDGLRLTAAGFTNLTRDHLDYHGTLENYFAAKLQLFERLLHNGAGAVINMDSDYAPAVLAASQKAKLAPFRVGYKGVELKLLEAKPSGVGQLLTIETTNGLRHVGLPLAGDFQVSNALVAAGLVIASGGELELALHALESLKGARGRLELVGSSATGGSVFVDYAHTPDALENVLKALRPTTRQKLTVVFGCGGDRDKGKRPLMGAIAAMLADKVIVTDDNPRSEAPETIRRDILVGAPRAENIGDRGLAIRAAIDAMREGDVVLIAGKGHEDGQLIGTSKLPFVDHDAARAAIKGEAYHG